MCPALVMKLQQGGHPIMASFAQWRRCWQAHRNAGLQRPVLCDSPGTPRTQPRHSFCSLLSRQCRLHV